MKKLIFVNGIAPYLSVIDELGHGSRITGNELDLDDLSARDSMLFQSALTRVERNGFRLVTDYRDNRLDEIQKNLQELERRLRGDLD